MARNRSPGLKRQLTELRGRYHRVRKWLYFITNDMDAMWRAEAGDINHLEAAAQLAQLERLASRMQKFFDLVPTDFIGPSEASQATHTHISQVGKML
jgi:hypothetical protein